MKSFVIGLILGTVTSAIVSRAYFKKKYEDLYEQNLEILKTERANLRKERVKEANDKVNKSESSNIVVIDLDKEYEPLPKEERDKIRQQEREARERVRMDYAAIYKQKKEMPSDNRDEEDIKNSLDTEELKEFSFIEQMIQKYGKAPVIVSYDECKGLMDHVGIVNYTLYSYDYTWINDDEPLEPLDHCEKEVTFGECAETIEQMADNDKEDNIGTVYVLNPEFNDLNFVSIVKDTYYSSQIEDKGSE